MDAITLTVIWLVVWFFVAAIAATVGAYGGLFLGSLGDWDNFGRGAIAGTLIGWLIGGAFAVFAVIQVILHIIDIVRLVGA